MVDLERWFRLNRESVENVVVHAALDLHEIMVIDSIEPLPEQPAIRMHRHDLYGPLPEILVPVDVNDRLTTLDRLSREGSILCAIGRIRRELAELCPGCEFLPPP